MLVFIVANDTICSKSYLIMNTIDNINLQG